MFLSTCFCACSQLFYHPSKENYPHPKEMQSLVFKDMFFHAEDGVRLHGRLFLTPGPAKGTLIHFHGNAENLSSHAAALAWITKHGYNMFTFDYRGYGRSHSSPSPKGIRMDARAAMDKAKDIHATHLPAGKFIVVGQSLGGAIALRAVEDLKDDQWVDLIVLDSAFSSYQWIAFKKLTEHWITWPFGPLAYLFISDKTAANLENINRPALIIHSENDAHVPFACAKRIYAGLASSRKTFWRGTEPGHILGFHSDKRRMRFLRFIEQI